MSYICNHGYAVPPNQPPCPECTKESFDKMMSKTQIMTQQKTGLTTGELEEWAVESLTLFTNREDAEKAFDEIADRLHKDYTDTSVTCGPAKDILLERIDQQAKEIEELKRELHDVNEIPGGVHFQAGEMNLLRAEIQQLKNTAQMNHEESQEITAEYEREIEELKAGYERVTKQWDICLDSHQRLEAEHTELRENADLRATIESLTQHTPAYDGVCAYCYHPRADFGEHKSDCVWILAKERWGK